MRRDFLLRTSFLSSGSIQLLPEKQEWVGRKVGGSLADLWDCLGSS
jgi:hypothetical protein